MTYTSKVRRENLIGNYLRSYHEQRVLRLDTSHKPNHWLPCGRGVLQILNQVYGFIDCISLILQRLLFLEH